VSSSDEGRLAIISKARIPFRPCGGDGQAARGGAARFGELANAIIEGRTFIRKAGLSHGLWASGRTGKAAIGMRKERGFLVAMS